MHTRLVRLLELSRTTIGFNRQGLRKLDGNLGIPANWKWKLRS